MLAVPIIHNDRNNGPDTITSIAMTIHSETTEALNVASASPLLKDTQQHTNEGLYKISEEEVDFQELNWDLCMAFADFLAVFLDQPGWYLLDYSHSRTPPLCAPAWTH
jgi:hypothetical protein